MPTDTNTGSLDAIAASMLAPTETTTAPKAPKAKTNSPQGDTSPAADKGVSTEVSADDAPATNKEFSADDLLQSEDEEDDDTSTDDQLHNDDATDQEIGTDGADTEDGDEDFDITDFGATDEERDAESDLDAIDTQILGEKDDNRLVSVTVDGEDRQVKLADLKRRYAGEGAIEKRLQEVTETRNATFQTYETGKKIIEATLQEFGKTLFSRTVPAPDESLRQTNPTQYLLQKDAFDREGQAIQAKFARLAEVTKTTDAQQAELKAQSRNAAAAELHKLMPVLRDPKKGPVVRQKIIEAAKFCGYSDAEIAACEDPKLFRAFAYVAKGMALTGKTSVQTAKPSVRTLKPTGAANKPRASELQRQTTAAVTRARKTGSVEDVAASMLQPIKRKRG